MEEEKVTSEEVLIDILCSYIKKYDLSIENIFDIGAHDLSESLVLNKRFPKAKIYSFEANPDMWDKCKSRVIPQITFNPVAVSNYNGTINFKICKEPKQSSVFKVNSEIGNHNPILQGYFDGTKIIEACEIIKEVEVPCIRLDSYPVIPDLIFMDIQGSEFFALKGLGDKLSKVKIITTELFIYPQYYNVPLFDVVNTYLQEQFEMIHGNINNVFDNFIYVNRKYLI